MKVKLGKIQIAYREQPTVFAEHTSTIDVGTGAARRSPLLSIYAYAFECNTSVSCMSVSRLQGIRPNA